MLTRSARQILQRHCNDPARVDNVIRRIKYAARGQCRAVFGPGQLVVGTARHDRRVDAGNAAIIQDRAKRIGTENIASDIHDRVGGGYFGAELGSQGSCPIGVNIGQGQPGAVLGQQPRQTAADAAGALHCDMDARKAVLAQLVGNRRLDAVIDAGGGKRTGIAARRGAVGIRQAGDMGRTPGHGDHIGFTDANVLGGDIASAQPLDRIAKGCQHRRCLGAVRIRQNHCLTAAHRQPGHGVLVAHPARQAQRIAHRHRRIAIMPEPGSARAGPKVGGVQRNNRGQPRGAVTHQLDQLVIIKIGLFPECGHTHLQQRHAYRGKTGATEGSRTPDLRYHKPAL